MKKTLLYVTALVVTVPLLLTACAEEERKRGLNLKPLDSPPAPAPAPAQIPGRGGDVPPPAATGQRRVPKTPGFRVETLLEVRRDTGATMPPARRALADSRVIESIADDLNRAFVMDTHVPVKLGPCGKVNAFYYPATRSITMCDEWVDFLGTLYGRNALSSKEFPNAVVAATAFVFAHEVGHALIDVFALDILGREEDVADQFAVYLLGRTKTGEQQALAAADTFGRLASTPAQLTWDEHSLGDQRAYNIFCWLYGSNPARHSGLVSSGMLPKPRADRCQAEYSQFKRTFDKFLAARLR
jgi:hypothetical protein